MNDPRPIRIQMSRRKGFRLQEVAGNGLPTVRVDRATKWGNIFIFGWSDPRTGERGKTPADVVAKFRVHLLASPDLLAKAKAELQGKNLVCWCPLPEPGEPDLCHAAVLLEIANAAVEA
jgi:Domain of unknown function (DUF4326)